MKPERILVTGANGFLGEHLCAHLASRGHQVLACVRHHPAQPSEMHPTKGIAVEYVNDICDGERWSELLRGIDVVVHLAARVHVMHDRSPDPLAAFRRVNVDGTRVLATQARLANVRRFVFLSSIKVNGEATEDTAFRADDVPGFCDPYGQSKWEAEEALKQMAAGSTMEWVIVRPTLIYGPRVRGNFLNLLRLVNRGLPLPLWATDNRRSLLSVYNLTDLLTHVLTHPAANGHILLAKDPEDISTGDLIRRIAKGLHRKPRLLPIPTALLAGSARLVRREGLAQRLFGNLVVDDSKTSELLDWKAPISLDSAIEKTCIWFEGSAAGRQTL